MVRLSVNINKIATLRNARGGNNPDLLQVAKDCERFGAQGITVHPRPDERHIRYADVMELKAIVTTEFNIEGNPNKQFIDLVEKAMPTQVTLVPDADDAITSNAGWDTIKHQDFLKEVIAHFKKLGIRTSIFLNPIIALVDAATSTGTDRIELYTEPYAFQFHTNSSQAIAPFITAATRATQCGLALNAGHDLDLHNLKFFKDNILHLSEVSIGHALVCDALYYGLENTIQMYLRALK